MPERIVTVRLTEKQAALVDEIAKATGMTGEEIMLEAVDHGLQLMEMGIQREEFKAANPASKTDDLDDGIPF